MARRTKNVAQAISVSTERTEDDGNNGTHILLPGGDSLIVRPKLIPTTSPTGKPTLAPLESPLLPIVLKKDGTSWLEANLWIIRRIENEPDLCMYALEIQAKDLSAYMSFIEEKRIDWLHFPSETKLTPIYLYVSYLDAEVKNGALALETGRRKISTVEQFYQWLIEYEYIRLIRRRRYSLNGKEYVLNKDKVSFQPLHSPYHPVIQDGGELHPLSQEHQKWLLHTLREQENTEIYLIHLLSLVSGARIDTILSLRVNHILNDHEIGTNIALTCGRGTKIHTRFNQKTILLIPGWLQEKLIIYAVCERAKNRRAKAVGGDNPNQYLFLTNQGRPMYEKKLPYRKNGEIVQRYIRRFITPCVQKKYCEHFFYKFQDLHASCGINIIENLVESVRNGDVSFAALQKFLHEIMCNISLSTTMQYLEYPAKMNYAKKLLDAESEWQERFFGWSTRTIGEA